MRPYHTGLPAGSNVTSEITHGTWILCSHGFTAPPLDISVKPPTPIPPTCNAGTPDSTIALQGIVRGNDKVEKERILRPESVGTPLWIGKADVKGPWVLRVEQCMGCQWKRGREVRRDA